MGSGNLSDSEFDKTLNHERGHAIHLYQVGPTNYLHTTAIPSLIGAGLTEKDVIKYKDYYNLPWERIADQFGGVDRGYTKGATAGGWIFWVYTILTPC